MLKKGIFFKRIMVIVLFFIAVIPERAALSESISGRVVIEGQANADNVVIYLNGIKGTFLPPLQRPSMDHINLAFRPSLLAILKGTTVNFPNSDPVFHSAFSTSSSNSFELGIYSEGAEKSVRFENPGVVEIFCHIHPYMHAFILVLENPYFTATDRDGRYTFSGVPTGTYVLKAWQGFLQATDAKKVTIDGNQKATVDFVLHPKEAGQYTWGSKQ